MKALCTNFRGYYPQLILGPLFKLLEAVLELMVPLLMANIIDVGIAGGDRAYVLRQGLFLLLLAVLGVAAATTCQYFASVAAFGFGASLRRQVFRHILSLSGHETDAIGAGSLITHITNDVNQVQNGVNMFIRLATRAPFLAIGSIVMAFVLNARIALIFLISTPLIVLVLYQVMKRTLPDYARIQQRQETLGTLTGQNLEGARVIRAFSRQESEKKDFAAASDAHSALTIQVGRISAALNPLTYVIANFAILSILWYGARFADRGLILSGDVFAMVNYMTQTLLALIVLATDEHALRQRHLEAIRRLAQTHPMVFIDVATLNPFDSRTGRNCPVYDGTSRRAVPAFLSNARSRDEVATHRAYLAAALNRELTRCGSHMIRSDSSAAMFEAFVRLVSVTLARSGRNQLRSAAMPELRIGG